MREPVVLVCPSSSRDGVVYAVTVAPEGYACSCPGFRFRRVCKHVNAALALRALPLAGGCAVDSGEGPPHNGP
jgi:hypothetical protein